VDGGLATFVLEPAFVLSLFVGAFHTCVYIFIRGNLGWHIPALLLGGVLGALVGQLIGARVGDPLRIGDYSLLWASLVAWVGIGMAIVVSTLVDERPTDDAHGEVRPRRD
jgi:uncharacterized membrane protein YfcA